MIKIINRLQGQVKEMNTKLGTLQLTNSDLETKFETLNQKFVALQKELSESQKQKQSLTQQLDEIVSSQKRTSEKIIDINKNKI